MADFRFTKHHRLLSAADYSRVFAKAEVKAACPELLFLARTNELKHPRLGLVIAKKHVKLAHQRNRIKRIIRESYRQRCQQQLPALDVVVLARKGIGEIDNSAMTLLLDKQWKRLCKRAEALQAQEQQADPC